MRGRTPLPPALKLARDDARRAALGEPLPSGAPLTLEPPECLDDEGRACWRCLVPQLVAIGLAGEINRNLFVRYCDAWSEWMACRWAADEGGESSAAWAARRDALHGILLRYEVESGLTAASRAKLSVKRPDKDALADFIAAKPKIIQETA